MLNQATYVAMENDRYFPKNFKLGAVIFQGKRMIASGFNHKKTHPIRTNYAKDPEWSWHHAESHALINAINSMGDVRGCSIAVSRVLKTTQSLASSKPCPDCWKMLVDHGISSVTYVDETCQIITEEM